jgi:hypothetical protein
MRRLKTQNESCRSHIKGQFSLMPGLARTGDRIKGDMPIKCSDIFTRH